MIILVRDQLPALISKIKDDFPRSLMIFHLARNALRERYAWPGLEFVVDAFPDIAVCICRPARDEQDYVPILNGYSVFTYSTNAEIFRDMVFRKTAVDWTQNVMFIGLPEPEHLVLMEHGNKVCIGSFDYYGAEAGFPPGAFFYGFDLRDLSFSYQLPIGLRIGTLSEKHAEQVAKEKDYGHFENSTTFFRHLLKSGHPSVALFDDHGIPVSYILYKSEGALGGAYTNPKYRGQGLFKIVAFELLKKLKLDEEIFVFGDTMISNIPSQNGQIAVGGKKYEGFVAHWITYTPSTNNSEHTMESF